MFHPWRHDVLNWFDVITGVVLIFTGVFGINFFNLHHVPKRGNQASRCRVICGGRAESFGGVKVSLASLAPCPFAFKRCA